MKWKKLGLVYDKGKYNSVPMAHFISENVLRIFFTSRDMNNQSLPFFVEYNIEKNKILKEQSISIPLGRLGTFDENGVMPTECIQKNNKIYLYYIGWNVGKTVPFRNAIGLAISKDNGVHFEKYSEGPILDRSVHDKSFVASCCVYKEQFFYRMYYQSCDKWESRDNKLRHSYNIKYAESKDGINWQRNGKVAINFRYKNEYAISVPRVLRDDNIYKMWYSYRASNRTETYRIGYAESENAIKWTRKDEEVGIDVSKTGWDSEMICYPYVFDHKGERYMLYNGNDYGKTGFGIAILEQD